ncbi:MAG: polyprenyl synthetase family protein [Candidatus Omnitrophica bacterium]|nr:polyprenyl synthetase family protein [Candidatus Omnitrophota bacterium]
MSVSPVTTRQLERYVSLIERALSRTLSPVKGSPPHLEEAMRYCVIGGGKRFRPLLCVGASEAVGGSPRQALSAACAIELIHTYSLVHDDLPAMDNADERRGRASCHRKFGQAMAILVGDALLTRAFELLSRNGVPNAMQIMRAIGEASGTAGLVGGQVLDLQCGMGNVECGMKQLEETARRKTGALITASVVAGGLAGRASSTALTRLRQFGQRLGLAFQLRDDVHDGDGLVKAVGRNAVERRVQTLIDQAQQTIAPLGQRAWALRELADWLATN